MDFLTSFPYWGIIVIILLNAWLVSRMNIVVDDHQGETNNENEEKPSIND